MNNEPAFPAMDMNNHMGIDRLELRYEGLTKCEYFAAKAMQALLSSIETQRHLQEDGRYNGKNFSTIVALNAIEFADELLKQIELLKKLES